MHHVVVNIRSQKITGAMSDEDLFWDKSDTFEADQGTYEEILTEEEKQQLENVLGAAQGGTIDDFEDEEYVALGRNRNFKHENDYAPAVLIDSSKEEKRGWFTWGKKVSKEWQN